MFRQGDTPTIERQLASHWSSQNLASRTISARLRCFRHVGGAQATRHSVQDYLNEINHPATRRNHLSMLRTTYRVAMALELVAYDPTAAVGRIRVPKQLPKPLSPHEIDLVLSQCAEPARSYCVLGLYAGLRAEEIAHLGREDLESYPGGWRLRIIGKGGIEALVPAHWRVVELLATWEPRPGLTGNSVSKAVEYQFKKLGIKGGVHRARHSFCTDIYEKSGHDLMLTRDLARHASVSTTQIYTKVSDARGASIVSMLA